MKKPTNSLDVLIVGAGFSGMYLLHRLRELGLRARVLDKGGDVGGTWYWNRYPGARCDVPTIEYSFSFDDNLQQTWDWQELMAAQPEILTYARNFADRYQLRSDMQFDTEVNAATFDAASNRWRVTTTSGEEFDARFLIMATGCLSVPNWPDIEGTDSFEGQLLHTGEWPHESVDFHDKHVGIIGTGSSAVQAIPVIAETAGHLSVFQRTPVYTLPAENHPLDDAFRNDIKNRYEHIRELQRGSLAGMAYYGVRGRIDDVGPDNILDITPAERRRRLHETGVQSLRQYPDVALDMEANEVACELYREYIASIVKDPHTAAGLMPRGYPIGCKRQVVDTNYYETFNRSNVTLFDLRDDPLQRITPAGVATANGEQRLDMLIFATGFDAMTGALNQVDIRGRDGTRLADKWHAGPRSYLGLQVAGFPNLFTVTGPGSPSVLSNMLVSIEQHCDWITDCLQHVTATGCASIEAEADAEDAWVEHVNEVATGTILTSDNCNSWYLGANIPGKTRVFMPYVGGVGNYRQRCDEVARAGYEGFRLA